MPIPSWLSRWSAESTPDPAVEAEASRLRDMSARFASRGLVWVVLTVSYGKEWAAFDIPHSMVAPDKDALRALVADVRARRRVLSVRFETASPGVSPGALGI